MLSLLLPLIAVLTHHFCAFVGYRSIAVSLYSLLFVSLFPSSSLKSLPSLKSNLIKTKQLIIETSPQSHFAKWAKLKRTFAKQKAEYSVLNSHVHSHKSSFIFVVSSALPILLWSFQILLLIVWRAEPVFYVPEQWFGPLTSWLQFPFAPYGSVGVFYWWSALNSVLDRLTALTVYYKSYKSKKLKTQ
ncbi:GET complex subunit get1 [Globomyces sp. JEL0801]|nr:GET complex subunit get1 [Globomyces sp. JEL0801]